MVLSEQEKYIAELRRPRRKKTKGLRVTLHLTDSGEVKSLLVGLEEFVEWLDNSLIPSVDTDAQVILQSVRQKLQQVIVNSGIVEVPELGS